MSEERKFAIFSAAVILIIATAILVVLADNAESAKPVPIKYAKSAVKREVRDEYPAMSGYVYVRCRRLSARSFSCRWSGYTSRSIDGKARATRLKYGWRVTLREAGSC